MVKRLIIFCIIAFITIVVSSCSQDDTTIDKLKTIYIDRLDQDSINIIKKENDFSSFIYNYPTNIEKSTEREYIIKGYVKKRLLDKYYVRFYFSYAGLTNPSEIYLEERYEYVNYVSIDKGYSLILPNFTNKWYYIPYPEIPTVPSWHMGAVNISALGHTSSFVGFSAKLVEVASNYEKYELTTIICVIVKSQTTNKNVTPTLYAPYGINPDKLEFRVKSIKADW